MVLLEQTFTARMPLLIATSAFRLDRRQCFVQQCYRHQLPNFANKWVKTLPKQEPSWLVLRRVKTVSGYTVLAFKPAVLVNSAWPPSVGK